MRVRVSDALLAHAHTEKAACQKGQDQWSADRKVNGILAPVSPGVHRQSPHRLDSASHLCTAACACK
jgi:hypothetical protein